MIIPLPRLLQGIIDTLDREVAAALGSGSARAQLYACLDLLNNLADKVDWKREMLLAEIEGIEEVLRAALPELERLEARAGVADLKNTIHAALASGAPEPLFDRRRELNQLLEDLIATVNDPLARFESSEEAHLCPIREQIHGHLRNQAIRDALYLKPMMLKKISQG